MRDGKISNKQVRPYRQSQTGKIKAHIEKYESNVECEIEQQNLKCLSTKA